MKLDSRCCEFLGGPYVCPPPILNTCWAHARLILGGCFAACVPLWRFPCVYRAKECNIVVIWQYSLSSQVVMSMPSHVGKKSHSHWCTFCHVLNGTNILNINTQNKNARREQLWASTHTLTRTQLHVISGYYLWFCYIQFLCNTNVVFFKLKNIYILKNVYGVAGALYMSESSFKLCRGMNLTLTLWFHCTSGGMRCGCHFSNFITWGNGKFTWRERILFINMLSPPTSPPQHVAVEYRWWAHG